MVLRCAVVAGLIGLLPLAGFAETWVEFHSEKYDYKSQKMKKKLNFRNRFYYDADSLKRTAGGDAAVWVKEESMTDKYYVKKGAPSSEDIIKKVHLWCGAGKYEILTSDEDDAGSAETGEKVVPGSMYEKLSKAVCEVRKEER
jgi:hypothetical protein